MGEGLLLTDHQIGADEVGGREGGRKRDSFGKGKHCKEVWIVTLLEIFSQQILRSRLCPSLDPLKLLKKNQFSKLFPHSCAL